MQTDVYPIYIPDKSGLTGKTEYYLIYSPFTCLTCNKPYDAQAEFIALAGDALPSFYAFLGEKKFDFTEKIPADIYDTSAVVLMKRIGYVLYKMMHMLQPDKEKRAPYRFAEAVNYFETHLLDGCSVASVCHMFNIPENTFREAFVKYKSETPEEFIAYQFSIHNSPIKGNHPEWLLHVLNYINDNYNLPDCIQNAKKLSYVSDSTFNTTFRMYTGITPVKYVIMQKLLHAEILLHGDDPIMIIAMKTGFYDSSAFSRMFSKFYGISPSAYRAKMRGDKK